MEDVNKCDVVVAVFLLVLFGLISGCCAGLVLYSIVFFNPVLILCGGFFSVLFCKETVTMYWIVLDMFDHVK